MYLSVKGLRKIKMDKLLVIKCKECGKESLYELPEGQYVVNVETIREDVLGIGNTYPVGKENVVEHIKSIGTKLIENAERIFDVEIHNHEVCAIEFSGRIAVNEVSKLEIKKIMNVKGTENAKNECKRIEGEGAE